MHLKFQATGVYDDTVLASEKYKIICHEGGSRCFAKHQRVITKNGSKKISEIKVGDYVLAGLGKEWSLVKNVFKLPNTKPCYKIKLKNGSVIQATQDHKVWFQGGWCSLKYVIKCWNERNMENNS